MGLSDLITQLPELIGQAVGANQWLGYTVIFAAMFLENLFPPIPTELIMPLGGLLRAAPEGHDQLRRNRREQVLKEHRREDRGVAQPLVRLHRLADQLRQLCDQIRKPHGDCAQPRKSSMSLAEQY